MSKRSLRGLFWLAVASLLVFLSGRIAGDSAVTELVLITASLVVGWKLASAFSDGDDK